MVAKVMNVAYVGQRKVIVAGDVNAEDDSWLGCAAGSMMWDEMRSPHYGEAIAGICEAAGLRPVLNNVDPFTRRGAGLDNQLWMLCGPPRA